MQADVNDICCHFLPHWPIGRVGHANRDRVVAKAVGYFVGKPRFVPKLDRVSRAFPVAQGFDKFLQALHVLFQKSWELPDNSGKPCAQG